MATTERLINSTADLSGGLGAVQGDLNFDAFSSFVDDADLNHIIPAISYAGYNALCADGLSTDKQKALKLLQKAGANFAIFYFSAIGSVQIGESGIFVIKDQRQLPASDKKIYMLRVAAMAAGFVALEAAVNFMEANLGSFPEYAADPVHQANRSRYINTTDLFSQGFNLNGNSQVFASLKSQQATVEENYIDPLLGDDVSEALRTAITAGSTSSIQNELLVRIAKAVAPLTIAEAIPWRMISIDASGLITPTIKNNIENVEVSTEADLQRLQAVMNKAVATGKSEIAKLKNWLATNISQFPGYVSPDLDAASKLNDNPRGFFFV